MQWRIIVPICMFLLFTSAAMAQNSIIFSVTAGGDPVIGITVDVNGITRKTNSSGQAVLQLPDGEFFYSVYTEGYDESFTVGSETFTFFDLGGSGSNEERYDNVFTPLTTITVSGDATENIALSVTTFNTTIGVSSTSAEFNIHADYTNRNGSVKTKLITTLISDASGTITAPLPTHRDDRRGNILSFDAYYASDVYGAVTIPFDPVISPVNIAIPALNTVDFTITAGGSPVEGIYLDVAGETGMTDASGKVSVFLPDGTYNYSVYTSGYPESFTIGSITYTYQDMGGRDREDSYDNYFKAYETVIVSGATSENVSLGITNFKTQKEGVDASLEFDIIAEHSGGGSDIKTITSLTSNASGEISLPLPTHRDRRRGDIFEFLNYQYLAEDGVISDTFELDDNPVLINVPPIHEITFDVKAGGIAVEGITIDVNGTTSQTDASGKAVISIPEGESNYSVYTNMSPETITVGSNTFTYVDDGGGGSDERYDNIFTPPTAITVSGDGTVNISLPTTTFNTTLGVSAASVEFNILADYMNRNGSLKTKLITTLTSDASGTITAPLPTHRDDRQGNILSFDAYYATDVYGALTIPFDPVISPVNIAIPALNTVGFTITAGGSPVEGIYLDVAGKTGRTDASGQISFDLPDGTFYYNVYTSGDPESFTIGSNTFIYQDMGGRDREDSYDNYFVVDDTVMVSGATSENVSLGLTNFKTQIEGVDASLEFDIIAEHSGGGDDIKTIASLTSNASGEITLPLPTHRDRRSGGIMEFINYQYLAVDGIVHDNFELDENPVLINVPPLHEITFDVQAGGIAVEGITVDVNGTTVVTDASGQAVISIPEGEYSYSVYTNMTPEAITVGSNTFTYLDEGGRGSDDRYDNIFILPAALSVTGAATESISLPTTTFITTLGGTAASAPFNISAGYINSSGKYQTKTITTLTSDASGTISAPLPTHRNDRDDDTLMFYNYSYNDLALSTIGLFFPNDSPVTIALPIMHDITFMVKADQLGIEGLTVKVNDLMAVTDASGQAVIALPEGEVEYMVLLSGDEGALVLDGESYEYLDLGGYGLPDRYDNIFKIGTLNITGTGSKDISLETPEFITTKGGTAASLEFTISADYYNSESDKKTKTIIRVSSDESGHIRFPIPTHRTSREGDIHKFFNFSYSDLLGIVSDTFDPTISPITIAMPSCSDVTFAVTSGGTAVEGITVGINALSAVTNATGEVILSLPDGSYDYWIYAAGTPEIITIGGKAITYLDEGGNQEEWELEMGFLPNFYDNIFHLGSIDVSGVMSENVALRSTTFNTTVNGNAAPVSFLIAADYVNDDEEVKTKIITAVTSDASGTVSLPLPDYRDDRRGAILDFFKYYYGDLSETEIGVFNPDDSPVVIAFGNLQTVTFTVLDSATSNPITGAIVSIDGAALSATDGSGEASTNLASGTYNYTVSRGGYFNVASTSFSVSDDAVSVEVTMRAYETGVETHKPNAFIFYPNPATDMVTVRFPESYSGSIELISPLGQIIKRIQVNDALTETINLSELKNGMYFLKAGSYSKILVKQ